MAEENMNEEKQFMKTMKGWELKNYINANPLHISREKVIAQINDEGDSWSIFGMKNPKYSEVFKRDYSPEEIHESIFRTIMFAAAQGDISEDNLSKICE